MRSSRDILGVGRRDYRPVGSASAGIYSGDVFVAYRLGGYTMPLDMDLLSSAQARRRRGRREKKPVEILHVGGYMRPLMISTLAILISGCAPGAVMSTVSMGSVYSLRSHEAESLGEEAKLNLKYEARKEAQKVFDERFPVAE